MRDDFLYFPNSTTVGEALQTYSAKDAQYWWLLITAVGDMYHVCSLGDLLPYLTGRLDHIVDHIGDCVICCAVEDLFWKETPSLAKEALADDVICQKTLAELPLPKQSQTCVTIFEKGGIPTGIEYPQMR